MDLKQYDGKCVRITTIWDEVFEGYCNYNSAEYNEHEFGTDEDCLQMVCFLFYGSQIREIASLEDVSGPYGKFSAPYGLLEESASVDGTVLIDEFFDSEDPEHIVRMIRCLKDRLCGKIPMPDNITRQDLEAWLEESLKNLVKYNDDEAVRAEAKDLLAKISGRKDPEKVTGICGLFCKTCPSFADGSCDGCLSDHVTGFCQICRHGFRICAQAHGITWCFECPDFPCERQKKFKDCHVANGISHHEHVMEDVERQRSIGLEAWVREQDDLNACPVCGSMTIWCEPNCPVCGAELSR